MRTRRPTHGGSSSSSIPIRPARPPGRRGPTRRTRPRGWLRCCGHVTSSEPSPSTTTSCTSSSSTPGSTGPVGCSTRSGRCSTISIRTPPRASATRSSAPPGSSRDSGAHAAHEKDPAAAAPQPVADKPATEILRDVVAQIAGIAGKERSRSRSCRHSCCPKPRRSPSHRCSPVSSSSTSAGSCREICV